MAGAAAERQESGFVKAVRAAVKRNAGNPITLIAGKTTVTGVIDARKYTGRQESGSEPYTDVQIITQRGKKQQIINCSLKGESAPSLAGGGLRGLESVVPGLARRYMKAVLRHLTEREGLRPGDKVPDVYGAISESVKRTIVVGNAAMGGPIDFMYIGPMSVASRYDANKNTLTLNGELIPAEKYAKTHSLYFRLRARREDQRFDPAALDNTGTPKVYGKSPSRGDSAGRIVVTDRTPGNAIVIRFS